MEGSRRKRGWKCRWEGNPRLQREFQGPGGCNWKRRGSKTSHSGPSLVDDSGFYFGKWSCKDSWRAGWRALHALEEVLLSSPAQRLAFLDLLSYAFGQGPTSSMYFKCLLSWVISSFDAMGSRERFLQMDFVSSPESQPHLSIKPFASLFDRIATP